MPRLKMDAIEVASSIHKGDFSKLRGKSFEMCDNNSMGQKYTLNQLGSKVDKLESTVNQLASKVDQIADDLAKLTKYVINGFKQVNDRIDNLEVRVDRIEKRLDYNNLKPLPNSK